MRLGVLAAVFPLVLLAELPDKTMFASLLLAARGRPLAVWAGASLAFAVHVVIAVAAGRLLSLVPPQPLHAIVAALFFGAAIYALVAGPAEDEEAAARELQRVHSRRRVVGTAFLVVFIAEWGDLTQVLIANLTARYRDVVAVGVGSLAALVVAAGISAGASRLVGRLPLRLLRWVTAAVLLVFAGLAAASAV